MSIFQKMKWRYHRGVLVIAEESIHNIDDAVKRRWGMLVFAKREKLVEFADRIENEELTEETFTGIHNEAVEVIGKYRIPEAGQVDLWVPLNQDMGLTPEFEKLASIRRISYQTMFPDDWFTLTGWKLFRRGGAF